MKMIEGSIKNFQMREVLQKIKLSIQRFPLIYLKSSLHEPEKLFQRN